MKHLALLAFLLPGFAWAEAPTAPTAVQLNVGTLTLTTTAPAEWGKGIALPAPEDSDGPNAYIPVIDQSMEYKGMAFFKPIPKPRETDPLAITLALTIAPEKFKDDEGSTGPEEERDPYALTAAKKSLAIARLAKIYSDKGLDAAEFMTAEMESPKNLVGGWWGSPDAVLDILSIEYFENADGSLRGAAFFFTEGQDVNFNVTYRIVLYNSATRAVVLADCPLVTFPFVAKLNEEVGSNGESDALNKAYRKAEATMRDRSKWADSPMGALVKQFETTVKSAVVSGVK